MGRVVDQATFDAAITKALAGLAASETKRHTGNKGDPNFPEGKPEMALSHIDAHAVIQTFCVEVGAPEVSTAFGAQDYWYS